VLWSDLADINVIVRLHFIPLSPSYREVYNIHAFFSGATQSTSGTAENPRPVDGDRRLRRIARAGKQWKKTIGRTIDMEGKSFQMLFFSRDILVADLRADSLRVSIVSRVRPTMG
jgi:hypothetical protein